MALYRPPDYQISFLSVQEKFNIDFQDGCQGDDLGFPIRTVLPTLIYKSPRYFQWF